MLVGMNCYLSSTTYGYCNPQLPSIEIFNLSWEGNQHVNWSRNVVKPNYSLPV